MSNDIKFNVGDRIRDIEDSDLYYEGIVTEINDEGEVVTYLCTSSIIPALNTNSGENCDFDERIGAIVKPYWWYCEKMEITNE